MRGVRRLGQLGFLVAVAVAIASPGDAKVYISAQGGLFSPWDGEDGHSATFLVAGGPASGHLRYGGEFEYRRLDTTVFKVSDVEVDSFHIRFNFQFHTLPKFWIDPYFGAGLGVSVHSLDEDRIEAVRPGFEVVSSLGGGAGVLGLVGLEARVPAFSHVSIFGEARFGYTVMLTSVEDFSSDNDIEAEDLGGLSVHGGLRFSF